MTLSLSGACKWCGENPGTGRSECNRCRRIWLAGYEAARKQAVNVVCDANTCGCKGFCECYGASTLYHIEEQIRTMQPEKP